MSKFKPLPTAKESAAAAAALEAGTPANTVKAKPATKADIKHMHDAWEKSGGSPAALSALLKMIVEVI